MHDQENVVRQSSAQPVDATESEAKLAYHRPELRVYGQFQELTRATFSGVGAADNTFYAS